MLYTPPYLTTCRKATSVSLLFFMIAYLNGCQSKVQNITWMNTDINPAIVKNSVYEQLEKENEVFSFGEKQDLSMRRTSSVAYFTKGNGSYSSSSFARLNNCRAYFLENGILNINIGLGDGFSNRGFMIHYKGKQFYTEPYHSTDVVIPDEPEPAYEIKYQKLTLNKPVYEVGDSLYGNIDFKAIEIDQEGIKINHDGKGYFRTVVKE